MYELSDTFTQNSYNSLFQRSFVLSVASPLAKNAQNTASKSRLGRPGLGGKAAAGASLSPELVL